MIDTVKLFHPHTVSDFRPKDGWKQAAFLYQPLEDAKRPKQTQTFCCDELATGYHGWGPSDHLNYHRVSLSRLLHGSNGILIGSQQELDAAVVLLREKPLEWGTPDGPEHHFTRVDLCLHFEGDPIKFIRAHRAIRHPRIHRPTVNYSDRGLTFDGRGIRIVMYDKLLELKKKPGSIIRVEVQLTGRPLKELLGGGNRVTNLDFNICYRVYREILMGFQSSSTTRVTNIGEFLAISELAGWRYGGETAAEIYFNSRSRRQVQRLRNQMATAMPEIHAIDWAELLPVNQPPPLLDVNP